VEQLLLLLLGTVKFFLLAVVVALVEQQVAEVEQVDMLSLRLHFYQQELGMSL
jgi:hypothetical protein